MLAHLAPGEAAHARYSPPMVNGCGPSSPEDGNGIKCKVKRAAISYD